ncbi:tyrosine-type recombinase/integrase [Anaerosporobacter faecicola]|uniref:tyrosine-type recombinase/integrase n=1 Tax=Anaerosporobacter faecicola TaxID=2718714 RepID=UPI00143888D4|nr:tyrosine-type recombinase/integrase [Anaerosporobacter faecicola]
MSEECLQEITGNSNGLVNKQPLPPGITQRKDGRYQGRFTSHGKRYTLYDKNLRTLKKRLADAKYEAEHGTYCTGGQVTLNNWYQTWLEEYKSIVVKNSTILLYTTSYERYIQHSLGNRQLKEIRTIQIQKLYNDLQKNGLSVGTIQIVHAVLFNIFKLALKNEILMKNPCIGVEIPREDKKEPRVLTATEQEIFLEQIRGNYYESLLKVALGTGLRIGELLGLQWEDIDFDHNIISISRTLLYMKSRKTGHFCFQFQTPKSRTSKRIVPLIPALVEVLREQQQFQQRLRIARGPFWTPLSSMGNLVFTTKNGTPIQEVYIVKCLNAITKKINRIECQQALYESREPNLFEKITPHTLRHSFATRAFESGLAPKTVQELLGHSNINLTMNLYTHVTQDIKVREMEKLYHLFS